MVINHKVLKNVDKFDRIEKTQVVNFFSNLKENGFPLGGHRALPFRAAAEDT